MLNPVNANVIAVHNCIQRAGLPVPDNFQIALAWATSCWVNKLHVQVEALRLIGIEMDPELYTEATERAHRADAANKPN